MATSSVSSCHKARGQPHETGNSWLSPSELLDHISLVWLPLLAVALVYNPLTCEFRGEVTDRAMAAGLPTGQYIRGIRMVDWVGVAMVSEVASCLHFNTQVGPATNS